MVLINQISNADVRSDALELLRLIADETGEVPSVDGKTVGFGTYHYRYASGQEGDFFKIGFTTTAHGLTIYVMSGLEGFVDILGRLGKHTASKSTIKFRRFADIDAGVLGELVSESVRHLDEVERELGAIPRMSDIPPRVPRSRPKPDEHQ